ncbi:hypothetical protein [Escherichia coli]|nr:hypothetical protein [Escherichia coli]
MLHRDKQEYHEHLFSGVSGLFLSWSVVLSLNMLHLRITVKEIGE